MLGGKKNTKKSKKASKRDEKYQYRETDVLTDSDEDEVAQLKGKSRRNQVKRARQGSSDEEDDSSEEIVVRKKVGAAKPKIKNLFSSKGDGDNSSDSEEVITLSKKP
jgi:hypothetical protein